MMVDAIKTQVGMADISRPNTVVRKTSVRIRKSQKKANANTKYMSNGLRLMRFLEVGFDTVDAVLFII